MSAPRATFVIMAGGRGERLWPLVRAGVPKVCVSVDGRATLLQNTLARLAPLTRGQELLIVTTKEQAEPIRATLSRSLQASLVVEPQPRNTAACIALAAGMLARRNPASVMAALPADHWIAPPAAFQRALRAAIEIAQNTDQIVTIGIKPTRVHSGLGHLLTGRSEGHRRGCRILRLTRFIEKPSRPVAQRLLRQRRTYWNAGMFVGRATTFLELIRRWLPGHAKPLLSLTDGTGRAPGVQRLRAAYQALQPISFDDGVMARLRDGLVVEGNFQWEDLGGWDSWMRMDRLTRPDLAIASRNVRVLNSDGHLIAAVGLKDTIIVRTPDATLVCRTDQAQAVRDLAAEISRSEISQDKKPRPRMGMLRNA